MGLSYEIRGHENIVKNSGCVVVINHQSLLDLLSKDFLSSMHNFDNFFNMTIQFWRISGL